MTRLPLDFPPLREMAAHAADDVHSAALLTVFAKYNSVSSSIAPSVVMVDAHTILLSDLTRLESQTLWLRWLADRLGVPTPDVGAPEWRPMCERRVYQLGYGRNIALFIVGVLDRLGAVAIRGMGVPVVQCPALDNPDSADAPIRALVLAVLTVGGAA